MRATGAIRERQDAAAAVRCAPRPAESTGAYVDGLRDQCGMLIGGILEVVRTLTGRDLLTELLDPLAGDMGAVSSMQAGWREVATAAGLVGENFRGVAVELPGVWEGEAAQAAVSLTDRVARTHDQQREAATLMAEQLEHVLAVSRVTAELVCAALEYLDGIVMELLIEAAAGPLGWAKAGLSSPGRIRRMVSLVAQGVDAIQGLVRAVQAAVHVLTQVRGALDSVGILAEAIEAGAHADAGRRVDDVARAGF